MPCTPKTRSSCAITRAIGTATDRVASPSRSPTCAWRPLLAQAARSSSRTSPGARARPATRARRRRLTSRIDAATFITAPPRLRPRPARRSNLPVVDVDSSRTPRTTANRGRRRRRRRRTVTAAHSASQNHHIDIQFAGRAVHEQQPSRAPPRRRVERKGASDKVEVERSRSPRSSPREPAGGEQLEEVSRVRSARSRRARAELRDAPEPRQKTTVTAGPTSGRGAAGPV